MAPQERKKEVLSQALRLPSDERIPFIQAEFPADPAVWDELLAILDGFKQASQINPGWSSGTTFGDLLPSLAAVVPASVANSVLRVDAAFGPYRVTREIEPGGMGEVAIASDARLRRQVILKCLKDKWLLTPLARQRLMREATTVAALSHPNIATLYDVFDEGERPVLVMEYVEGKTLRDVLDEGPLPLGLALRYAIQLTDALNYAHDRGIIHCDIKPSNVQITPTHVAKVLDFGLARAHFDMSDEVSASEVGKVMGTPGYMAPERLVRGTLNTAGDIYGIGVVLFELLTNRPPYMELGHDLMLAALANDAPLPSSIVPGLPTQLDAITARALARNPRLRYRSALEFGRDLAGALAALEGRDWSGTFHPSGTATGAGKWKARAITGAVWVTAIAVGLTLAGFVTSSYYNYPLGREESALLWPGWGLSSMIAPIGTVIYYLVVPYFILVIVARAAAAGVAPFRRWFESFKSTMRSLRATVESRSISVLAQTVIAIQLVTLTAFFWRFTDMNNALMNFMIRSAGPAQLALLGPWNEPEHRAYRQILAVVVFIWVVLATRLIKLKLRRTESEGLGSIVGVVAVAVFTFALLVAPFRIWRQSVGERVLYDGSACHIVGQKSSEVILFCPLQAPGWTKIVPLTDPLLKRAQTPGSIFEDLQRNSGQ